MKFRALENGFTWVPIDVSLRTIYPGMFIGREDDRVCIDHIDHDEGWCTIIKVDDDLLKSFVTLELSSKIMICATPGSVYYWSHEQLFKN